MAAWMKAIGLLSDKAQCLASLSSLITKRKTKAVKFVHIQMFC